MILNVISEKRYFFEKQKLSWQFKTDIKAHLERSPGINRLTVDRVHHPAAMKFFTVFAIFCLVAVVSVSAYGWDDEEPTLVLISTEGLEAYANAHSRVPVASSVADWIRDNSFRK
uniref:Anti-sigma factor n=1 Tax=Panagrellus redivivus TaxID=6233 RepID=A0A7E4VXQ8_PANRE